MTQSICKVGLGVRQWLNTKGEFHRLDGPAVVWTNGDTSWWIDDQLHRLDGPAVEWQGIAKAWWIVGDEFSEKEFDRHPLVIFHRLCKGAA
jgi:hypothetical protein